jgi:hypothetical protein
MSVELFDNGFSGSSGLGRIRGLALIKEVENVPAKIFEYIGMSIQNEVGAFLTNLMGK